MQEQFSNKYILGGGFARKSADEGFSFYSEIGKDLPHHAKVLEILFGNHQSNWDEMSNNNQSLFRKHLPDKNITFIRAEINELDSQIDEVDLLFIYGGNAEILINTLSKHTRTLQKVKGKNIVGVSAGAYALGEKYLNVDSEGKISLQQGLKILPICIATHYLSDFYPSKYPDMFTWKKTSEFLLQNKAGLKLVTLKEGEYLVFRK